MKPTNVIVYILLGLCLMLLLNTTLQNCELKKEQQKLQSLQLAYRDSMKAQIDRITNRRIDTLAVINNYQKTIIKEVEKKKDEILNLTHIDSIIQRYFKYRPIDSTDR